LNKDLILDLLKKVRGGKLTPSQAAERLSSLPFVDFGDAKVDSHRALRQGFPEVILGEGKTPEQVAKIARKIADSGGPLLITRILPEPAKFVIKSLGGGSYDPISRTLVYRKGKIKRRGKGTILVISAGTSDMPVAEEAAVTAQVMGNRVERLYDVGVAGIHRLLSYVEKLRKARVIIVVAGMEGALASVVGGMVSVPVIAVPTSIGYGASFKGLAALLSMLNSCASNVSVVNIDNGFGAATVASTINCLK